MDGDGDTVELGLTRDQVSLLLDFVDDSIYEVEHYGRLLNGAGVKSADEERVVGELRELHNSLSGALGPGKARRWRWGRRVSR